MNIELSTISQDGQLTRPDVIPHILKWYKDYQHLLFDDFYPTDPQEYAQAILEDLFELEPFFWVVEVDGEPAGLVYLNEWYGDGKRRHSCQFHGILDKKFQKLGIGTAVGKLILSFVFEDLKLFRLEGWLDPDNRAMIHLGKNLGFKVEGTLRGRKMVNGKPQNELILAIIRPDYFRKYKSRKNHGQEKEQAEASSSASAAETSQ
jgi:ribosomal-protein-alanine N-acetyltransferase